MMNSLGLPLDQALAAVLAGMGRPPALLDGNLAEAGSFLYGILDPLGMAAVPLKLPGGGDLPRLETPAALLQLEGGLWLPLIRRPADADAELALNDGGLSAVPRPLPAFTGLAFAVKELPEAELDVEISSFLKRNWRYMTPIVAGGMISNVLNLVIPLFGSFVYDKVLGNGVSDTLWAMVLGVLLGVGMDFCTRGLRIQLVERMAVTSEGDIDRALFRGLLLRAGTLPPVGVVLDKYKQMLSSRDFVTSSYLLAAADLPFLLLYLFCIMIVAGWMVLVPIFWGLLTMLLNAAFTAPARQYDRQARRAGEQRVSILADLLGAREAVVTSRWGEELGRRWRRVSDSAATMAGRTRFWNSMVGAVASWSGNLSYASVMVVGAYMVEDHLLTSGGMMASSMLTSRCLMIVSSVAMLSNSLSRIPSRHQGTGRPDPLGRRCSGHGPSRRSHRRDSFAGGGLEAQGGFPPHSSRRRPDHPSRRDHRHRRPARSRQDHSDAVDLRRRASVRGQGPAGHDPGRAMVAAAAGPCHRL